MSERRADVAGGAWRRGVGRFVRTLVFLVVLVLIAVVWIFTLQNLTVVRIRFDHWLVSLPLALALLTAFLFGVIVTLLIVVPRWWSWRLRYHFLARRHRRLSAERVPSGPTSTSGTTERKDP